MMDNSGEAPSGGNRVAIRLTGSKNTSWTTNALPHYGGLFAYDERSRDRERVQPAFLWGRHGMK
jgi:hypothetical protein